MKSVLILIVALQIFTNMQAQDFVRELDKKTDKPLLRGQLSFNDILKESTCSWLRNGTADYEPNKTAITELQTLLPKYHILVFMGTWCEDTQILLPQLYKTLLMCNFDFNALEMYGVNRNKMAINEESKIYNIERVPTIIVMDRFREVGRIVESVNLSIEQDLSEMLGNDRLQQEANR